MTLEPRTRSCTYVLDSFETFVSLGLTDALEGVTPLAVNASLRRTYKNGIIIE
jgi:hypothetical protein